MTKSEFKRKYPEGKEFIILGTKYILHYDDAKCEASDASGLAELYSKKIVLSLDGFNSPNAFEMVEEYYKKVLRHELMHAFLFEMGLDKFYNNETLVDALAIKMPQLIELMKEV